MINRRIVFLFVMLTASALLSCSAHHTHSKDWVQLKIEPLQTKLGWGYEIFAGEKLYIKQDKVPIVSGNQGFKTKEQALVAGQMVIEKLKKGKSPALDSGDLKMVGIDFQDYK